MAKDLFHAPEFLELIDWHDITNAIGIHACFLETKKFISSTQAFVDPELVEYELKRLDYIHELPSATSRLVSHLSRLGENFSGAAGLGLQKGRVPTIQELHQYALLIEAEDIWQEYFVENSDPDIGNFLNPNGHFPRKILKELRDFIQDDGSINDRGFLEMRQLTDELFQVESEARKKTQELRRRDPKLYSEVGEFDIINDRYVLPVSSDHYSSQCGPIIHRSRTGMTLYIEPFEMKPYSLKRAELSAKREWLIFKKCRDLGLLLQPHFAEFDRWSKFAIDFDRIQAIMSFSKQYNLVRPRISDRREISLAGLFHPLIQDCISNDIELTDSTSGFILSGPNTGGKTVVLKSIALSVCLLRLGAWVPSESATLFPYKQLYFFSHDLQSLEEGLSSFSSEVKNYSALIDEVGNDSLIIIDEIFNSTSSEEASALAVSLLEFLEETVKPHILLSTHHHGIKTTASSMERFLSCHMMVDSHGVPLYKIAWGSPGSSRGIDTFLRLTGTKQWSKRIFERAKTLLGSQIFDYESALTEINAQRAEYLLRTNEALEQIKLLKSEHEAFRLQKESSLQQIQQEQVRRFTQLVEKAKSEIEHFKRGNQSERKTLDQLSSQKRELVYEKETHRAPPATVAQLPLKADGLQVWSPNLSKSGIVLQDKGSKLLIDFKGLRSWCKREQLMLLKDKNKPSVPAVSVNIEREVIGKTSVDGRGKRLEMFQNDVLAALHELLNGEIPFLDIIHGHGDGILKKWVRKHLDHDKDFDWSPLDGNDGATRVLLKK